MSLAIPCSNTDAADGAVHANLPNLAPAGMPGRRAAAGVIMHAVSSCSEVFVLQSSHGSWH
jgi:hypothetical protein